LLFGDTMNQAFWYIATISPFSMLPYLVISTVVIMIVVAALRYSNALRKARTLEEIRSRWGVSKPENKDVDKMDLVGISRLASVNPLRSAIKVSAQLTNDIDFIELFAFIDRTVSRVGQQYLFRRLLFPERTISKLETFDKLVEWYGSQPKVREQTQLQLNRLTERSAYHVANLFQPGHIGETKWLLPPWLSLVALALCCVATYWTAVAFLLIPVPLAINMVMHYWNKRNTFHLFRSMPQLIVLIGVTDKLVEEYKKHKVPGIDIVAVDSWVKQLAGLRRKVSLVEFSQDSFNGDVNAIGSLLGEFVKGALLVEVYTYNSIAKEIDSKYHAIEAVFDFVGRVDSAIAVASVRAGKLKTCRPTLRSDIALSVNGMVHPLVNNCTANSIDVAGRGVLITGSNMAGKTTFLRTLVTNALLGQTIYTCFASAFSSPTLNLSTYIRIEDDLMSGSSYFFREVAIIKEMVAASESGNNLFVLDELFKGTNTVERIAAAKAVLTYLHSRNNIVIISTHDLELVDLLDGTFDLYHFTETIEGEELRFDHKLKPGPLTTRNAVKILKISGYPAEITDDALRLAQSMLHRIADQKMSSKNL
jgi:hypothetical protein